MFTTRLKKKICKGFTLILVFTLNILSVNAQQDTSSQLRLTQQQIIAKKSTNTNAPGSSTLSAVQEIVIYGDPAKPGLYTILLKVAAHTKIPAHFHPDERIGTVVSGTWYFGYGDVFDESKLEKLPVGSIYSEGNNQHHFAMTGDEPVIAAITGFGPSGVTFINAADDPKNKSH